MDDSNMDYRDYEPHLPASPCEVCRVPSVVLPLLGTCTWAGEYIAIFYLLGLINCFLGLAIIADFFMCSIEKITTKTKKVYLKTAIGEPLETCEVRIWSDTIANLTLVTLGASAPEILLSIIEIFGNNFEYGDLGPGTIVGSAAFNMFVILAIGIVSVPTGETRRIKDITVFSVTAIFSVLAYVWLIIMLMVISYRVIESWEALFTFYFFEIFIALAWLAERFFGGKPDRTDAPREIELTEMQPGENNALLSKQYFKDGHIHKEDLVEFVKEVKKYPGLMDEDASVLAVTKLMESQDHSRMWYRINAVRNMTGGRKTTPTLSTKLKQVYTAMNERPKPGTVGNVPETEEEKIMIDENFDGIYDRLLSMTNDNLKKFELGHNTWLNQIKCTLCTNGGDYETATKLDYFMHYLTFGWKIIFSVVPPASLAGGWICLFVAFILIVILTAIIGDLARMFGCLVGISDLITAITLVTLGFSLPDIFAAKPAAVGQMTADSSIINVTGRIVVNVFFGIGLTWLIAVAYHIVNGNIFIVYPGGLGLSFATFACLHFLCIVLLLVRRFSSLSGKAEFGGPNSFKYISAGIMIFFWLAFVTVSILDFFALVVL